MRGELSAGEASLRCLAVPSGALEALLLQLDQAAEQGEWLWLQPEGSMASEGAGWCSHGLPQGHWPDGGGVVLTSGGSRGGRSLCLQPWEHLDRSAMACGHWLEAAGFDLPGLLLLNPLPFHHVSGLMPWWRSRLWGATHQRLVPAVMKDPSTLLATCQALPGWGEQPAVVSLVPTQLKRLMAHPAGIGWLQQLAVVWVGGAELSEALAQQARDLCLNLAPCYGATETAAMVAVQTPDQFLQGEKGCGSPLTDVELALDADGALMVRTQRLATARWRDGQWAAVADAEGWWQTGDVAELSMRADRSQRLLIRGRLDGAIHSGGETVFPEQLADRLLHQADALKLPLKEVLLLPVPSAEWGQRLVGLVRCHGEADLSSAWLSIRPRLEAIASRWLPEERPQSWHHCPELERSDAGKWQRRRWQEWLAVHLEEEQRKDGVLE
ncbi:MAG: AMP-binding protein [Synechococcus sp.]|nr:AMP-binding protein [Synechococcus sp.]